MQTSIPAVFPILAYKRNQDVFVSHGSAFFINTEGIFVSAGHNFKNPTRTYKAIIDGKFHVIEPLHHEYKDHEDQSPELYHDLFIGRIPDMESPNFHPLMTASGLNAASVLVAAGYNFQNYGPPGKMEDLYADLLNDDDDDDEILSADDKKIARLKFGQLDAVFVQQQFKHINKYIEQPLYKNGFSIQLPVPEPHGYSGGPILSGNNAVGMLISEHGAIGADHIMAKISVIQSENKATHVGIHMATSFSRPNSWLQDHAARVHKKLLTSGAIDHSVLDAVCFVMAEEISQLKNPVLKGITVGIGGVKGNYLHAEYGKYVHLVVINGELCDQLNFTATEVEGAIAHELGHLFNGYPQKKVPIPFDSWKNGTEFDPNEAEQIKYENALHNESFADAFARAQGYGDAVIRGLNKYSALPGAANIEMIQKRLVRLQSAPEPLTGQTITLTQL